MRDKIELMRLCGGFTEQFFVLANQNRGQSHVMLEYRNISRKNRPNAEF